MAMTNWLTNFQSLGLWARNHFVQLVHGRLVAKPVSRLCCVTLIPAVIRVTNDGGPDTRRWSDSLDLDNICHDVKLDQISLTLRAPELHRTKHTCGECSSIPCVMIDYHSTLQHQNPNMFIIIKHVWLFEPSHSYYVSPVDNTSQTNGNEMNGVGNLIFHETEVAEVHFIFMGEVRVRILASYWS